MQQQSHPQANTTSNSPSTGPGATGASSSTSALPSTSNGNDKEKRQRNSSIAPLLSPRTRQPITRNQSDCSKSPPRPPVAKKTHTPSLTDPTPGSGLPRHNTGTRSGSSNNTAEKEEKKLVRPPSSSVSVSNLDRDDLSGKKKARIRIKTCHKTLVCSFIEKGQVEHSVNQPEDEYIWTRFELGPEGNVVSLRNCYNRYLSTEKGNGKLSTVRARKQTEIFVIERITKSEKKFAIKTPQGEYLSALPGGALVCNRFGPQAWETFEIEEEPFAPLLFGGHLNEIVVFQMKNGVISQVPHVLEVLAEAIIKLDGYSTEGIFRISGDGAVVMKLRSELVSGNYDINIDNCHNAATLFKLFLRELAEPVFPDQYYPTALRLAEEHNIKGIQEMIKKFDNINVKVIQFVMNFLISFLHPTYVEKTMMTSNNLATVFAPTLLRCPSDNPLLQITASSSEVKFVLLLLENFPSDLLVDFNELLNNQS